MNVIEIEIEKFETWYAFLELTWRYKKEFDNFFIVF
jgi:hypothetical protein